MQAIDLQQGLQAPVLTDAALTSSVNPQYSGLLVAFFAGANSLDPASVFLGGNPLLGVDPAALQVVQEVPGVGAVRVPIQVTVEVDRILMQPLPPFAVAEGQGFRTALPAGQYSILVSTNVSDQGGASLPSPAFHTFNVGPGDTIPPRLITSSPQAGESGVGAGLPPQEPPGDVEDVAEVIVDIFGPPTPDVVLRFSEPIAAASVTPNSVLVRDIGGVGAAPLLPPAPGYPRLKSVEDGSTLPSNGHEVLWRVDPLNSGGFPFGTTIECTVLGADGGTDALEDISGNALPTTSRITFSTVAPPVLPENPPPEYAIWWSALNRCGVLDPVNAKDRAIQFSAVITAGQPNPFPGGITPNVFVDNSDVVAIDTNIPNFDPFEIVFDGRTNGATCHSWVYVQSPQSGHVAILHTRDAIPVGLLGTPTPGGISVQTGVDSGDRVLVVTNSGANTLTAYSLASVTAGSRNFSGSIFIQNVQPTGNNPQAVSITGPPSGDVAAANRHNGNTGPFTSLILYATATDGVLCTTTLDQLDGPVREFSLGANANPNDISLTPLVGIGGDFLVFGAVSLGGLPNEGEVAVYVSNPGGLTGQAANFDILIGSATGLDGPNGLCEMFSTSVGSNGSMWAVAETTANRISFIGLVGGQPTVLPNRWTTGVGINPTSIARRASWSPPCIAAVGSNPIVCGGPSVASCRIQGTEMWQFNPGFDGTLDPSTDLYICAQGQSQITVVDASSGARPMAAPPVLPGVRYVASAASQ